MPPPATELMAPAANAAAKARAACDGSNAAQAPSSRRMRRKLASGRVRSAFTLTNTTTAPGSSRPRSMQMPLDEDAGRVELGDERRDAAVEREAPRQLGVRRHREDRHARAKRRQHARGLAAAGHRDDGGGVPALGQRHRRFAQRAVVRDAGHLEVGLDLERRANAFGVANDRVERRHGARRVRRRSAVSPDIMIASTASSTALAASLTSARVGRGSVRIESKTWVATMTGRPAPAGAAGDLLLHARHVLERHLEAEIAARHHDPVAGARGSPRCCRPPPDARSWR